MVAVKTVAAIRYVMPLREGGSLRAIVEADDDGMYVLKFRGAGQGPKVLAAELLACCGAPTTCSSRSSARRGSTTR